MKLRFKNSRMLAVLITAIFLFSLFPGYGFAEESPELANVPVVNTASEPGMSQDVVTGGETDETPGEGSGETPGGGTDETPGDGSGETPGGGTDETLGDGSGETTGGEADGIPDDNNNGTNEQENTGDDPQGNSGDNPDGTPGEDPQGNPGENPEGTPGDELDEQLDENIVQQPMLVIPEKVTLTINHVLDLGDGNDKPAYTETIEGLDAGATVRGSDYQVREEGIVFVGSQPEELVLGSGENLITLLYSPQKEMPENPDYLNGPQAISAPEIYYPMAPMASKMMKGFNVMGVLGSGVDENGNITDSNTPGYISLNKEANKIADNQWQITLTISGVPKTETTDIVLVIDRSGSMSGSKLSAAKEAARNFVNRLLPDGNTTTRIALVSFAGNVTTHNSSNPFRTALEKQNLLNDINSLSASGGTFTQAGLRQAQALLDNSTADNKVIVLLSDGVPTYSYKVNNPDNYLEFWKTETRWFVFVPYTVDLYRTHQSVPESAFNYNSVVGDGNDSEDAYDSGNTKYYSHGNSAIAQSSFAKAAGQTIYTIALEAGTEGNRVLNGIASPGKAYTARPADLDAIFSSIASAIAPAATNATITDPMGYWFSIPGINESNYGSLITVNEGTIEYNTGTETIRWHLDAISTGPYTMSYIVEIDPGAPSGTHDTNGDTPINYTNINGNPAEKPFPIPVVEITGAEVDLIYHPNGGEGTMNPRTEPIGKTFNLDANAFTRTGFTFQGWSTSATGNVEYLDQAEFTMPAGGATLYAVWQIRTDISYTVEYELADGTKLLPDKVVGNQTYGATVTETAEKINGYNVDQVTKTLVLAAENNVITFIYSPRDDIAYTVNYLEKDTGKVLAPAKNGTGTFREEVTETAIDIEGYNKVDPDTVTITLAVSGNEINFYYKKIYNVFYHTNYDGGSAPTDDRNYVEGEEVEVKDGIDRDGFAFIGWNTKQDGSGIFYIPGDWFIMPAEDVHLYAMWAKAVNDKYRVAKNTLLEVAAEEGVLANDIYPPELAGLFASQLTGPMDESSGVSGEITNFGWDGSFSYRPENDFVGIITFFYAIGFEGPVLERASSLAGDNGEYRDWDNPDDPYIAKVTIEVFDPNKAPFAVNDAYSTQVNTTLTVAEPGVLSNDTDDDKDSLTAVLVNGPSNGTVTLNADGSFTYTPNANFTGTDSFTYQAYDGTEYSNVATVTITVTSTGGGGGGGGGGDTGGGGGTTETEEIVVEPEATLVPLNKEDHFAYIAGYPDNTVKPEGNVTREEVAAVFYRLLDETYRESVKTDVNNFSDVEAGRWSNTQISTLASIGVITGYPDGTFRPSNSITRAELATIASKFDNLSPFEADSFSDIAGHWANQYINSAAQKGWIKGYEDGTFRPQQAITRAEFVTLVNNVLGRKVLKENILPEAKTFPDLSTNAWYYEAMMEAINGHYYERENPDDYEVWTELYESHIDL